MLINRNRFQLSPRLRVGVGRINNKSSILKYISTAFIVLSVLLSINTFRVFLKTDLDAGSETNSPKVLGISDTRTQEDSKNQYIVYVVKKGDTLFNIAQAHNISWTTLATLNNIDSPFTVSSGQELKIPKP